MAASAAHRGRARQWCYARALAARHWQMRTPSVASALHESGLRNGIHSKWLCHCPSMHLLRTASYLPAARLTCCLCKFPAPRRCGLLGQKVVDRSYGAGLSGCCEGAVGRESPGFFVSFSARNISLQGAQKWPTNS